MSSTQASTSAAADPSLPKPGDVRFEVTTLPVADVDRAKAFYEKLGWRLDIDFEPAPGVRGGQFTPPGSPASIQFGSGPVSMKADRPLIGLLLIVENIEAAREDLIGRGVEVDEVFHIDPGKGVAPGRDPENRPYFTRANFSDPDGNVWTLQEITQRLPGRV